jgi:hypothetical protein
MAASMCTQHNERATRNYLIKTILCVAQIVEQHAAGARPIFPLSRPISLKDLGEF